MSKSKLAVTLDETLLSEVDSLVEHHVYPNRSQAIEDAVRDKLSRLKHTRLARECALLDPDYEKAVAEEGMNEELKLWPAY